MAEVKTLETPSEKQFEYYVNGETLLHVATSEGEAGSLSNAKSVLFGDSQMINPYFSESVTVGVNCNQTPDQSCLDYFKADFSGGYYHMKDQSLFSSDSSEASLTRFGMVPLGDFTWTHHLLTEEKTSEYGTYTDALVSMRLGAGAMYYRSKSENEFLGDFGSVIPTLKGGLFLKMGSQMSLDIEGFASLEREVTIGGENTNFALDIFGMNISHWAQFSPKLYNTTTISYSQSTSSGDLFGEGYGVFASVQAQPSYKLNEKNTVLGRLAYHHGDYDAPEFQYFSSSDSLEYGLALKRNINSHWYLQGILKQQRLFSGDQHEEHAYVILGHSFSGQKNK